MLLHIPHRSIPTGLPFLFSRFFSLFFSLFRSSSFSHHPVGKASRPIDNSQPLLLFSFHSRWSVFALFITCITHSKLKGCVNIFCPVFYIFNINVHMVRVLITKDSHMLLLFSLLSPCILNTLNITIEFTLKEFIICIPIYIVLKYDLWLLYLSY